MWHLRWTSKGQQDCPGRWLGGSMVETKGEFERKVRRRRKSGGKKRSPLLRPLRVDLEKRENVQATIRGSQLIGQAARGRKSKKRSRTCKEEEVGGRESNMLGQTASRSGEGLTKAILLLLLRCLLLPTGKRRRGPALLPLDRRHSPHPKSLAPLFLPGSLCTVCCTNQPF